MIHVYIGFKQNITLDIAERTATETELVLNSDREDMSEKKLCTFEAGKQAQQIHLTSSICKFSIYTLSDLGVSNNLIGSLSLANEHYSPPTE